MNTFASLRAPRGLLRAFSLVLSTWLAASPPAWSDEATLVKDLRPGVERAESAFLYASAEVQGRVVFGAYEGATGIELWASDGTARGTMRIADLCPGRCNGSPERFVASGNLVYFYGRSFDARTELWRTDGTASGTFLLAHPEIEQFANVSLALPFADHDLLFSARQYGGGWALWRSDGTVAGTRRLTALPSSPRSTSFEVVPRGTFDGRVLFTWDGGVSGLKLWESDGTPNGTHLFRRFSNAILCGEMVELGDALLFAGQSNLDSPCGLWRFERGGRKAVRLRDFPRGGPFGPRVVGGAVYLSAFDEGNDRLTLWRSDGTTFGTKRVRRAAAAPGREGALFDVQNVGSLGSRVIFLASLGGRATIWSADGLVAHPLSQVPSYAISSGLRVGDSLYFTLSFPNAPPEIWRTRGTPETTARVLSPYPVCGNGIRMVANRRLLLEVALNDGRGCELARLDEVPGAETRLVPLGDIAHPGESSVPRDLVATDEGLLFLASPEDSRFPLWRSNGQSEQTVEVGKITNSPTALATHLSRGQGGAFYLDHSSSTPDVFGWTDGHVIRPLVSEATLRLVSRPFALLDRTLVFVQRDLGGPNGEHRIDLVASDGTVVGTEILNVAPEIVGSSFSFVIRAAVSADRERLFYLIQTEFPLDPPRPVELRVTDGTAAGTHMIARLNTPRGAVIRQVEVAGEKVFVWVSSRGASTLWVSEGTTESTRAIASLADTFFPPGSSAVVGERVYFVVFDALLGSEVWVSDGTPEGTHVVADLAPGKASSLPLDLTAWGDHVVFSADDRQHGRELWVSDGTTEGTQRIEIRAGNRGSDPQQVAVVGSLFVFAADDGVHGLEPWSSDGTPEGTRLLADVEPGRESSSPEEFVVAPSPEGEQLYFRAQRGGSGLELWRIPKPR